VFARGGEALELPPSDAAASWEAALLRAGIPVALSQGRTSRPRLMFAAPLPAGLPADADLADLVLTERLTRADLWRRLGRCLPAGYRLVDLYDVWLGEPTLTARLVAADYRVTVANASPVGEGEGADLRDRCREACRELLGAATLSRIRPKGVDRSVAYDLRPLIVDLSICEPDDASDERCVDLRMRLRLGGEGASGRPDEVVRGLAERLGRELTTERTVRERLLTADDLDAEPVRDRTDSPDSH
jgi:radical SAM-linked protein